MSSSPYKRLKTCQDQDTSELDILVSKLEFNIELMTKEIKSPEAEAPDEQGIQIGLESLLKQFIATLVIIGDKQLQTEKLKKLLDENYFPKLCQFILSLDSEKFDIFQQILFDYLFTDCVTNLEKEFEIIQFVADLYAFICQIAPKEISEEIIKVFLSPLSPPHVRLIVVPSILFNYENYKDSDSTEFDIVENFENVIKEMFKCKKENNKKKLDTIVKQIWGGIQNRKENFNPSGPSTSQNEFCENFLFITFISSLVSKDLEDDTLILILYILINYTEDFKTTPPEILISSGIFLIQLKARTLGENNLPNFLKFCSQIIESSIELSSKDFQVPVLFLIKCIQDFTERINLEDVGLESLFKERIMIKLPILEKSLRDQSSRNLRQRQAQNKPVNVQSGQNGSTGQNPPPGQKAPTVNPNKYAETFVKIVERMESEKMEFSEADKSRIQRAMSILNNLLV